MLIPAHVLQIPQDLQDKLTTIQRNEVITLRLRLESGDEEMIVTRVSAVDVSEHVVRIEGTITYKDARGKLIAQVLRREITEGPIGYAELTVYI